MNEYGTTEAAILESGWKYRLLVENIKDVFWTMDLNGQMTYVSPSVTAQTGYLPEEYYEMSIDQFLTPESAAQVATILRDELSHPPGQRIESAILELQERTKSGAILDIEINASWIRSENGTPTGIIGITRDITTRKRAEEELRESEERFRAFFSLASVGIVIHENGVIIDANQAAADLAGYPNPESLIGKHGLDDIPFTAESRQALQSHLSSPSPENWDAELLRPDGTCIRIVVQGRATTLKGRPVRIASFLDVTDRYEAELALRESEAKFRTIGMSAPDALVLMNDSGRVEYWNPAAERMFGYSVSEIQGTEVQGKIIPETFRPQFQRAFQGIRKTGAGEAVGRVLELTAKRKDSTEFPVEIAINSIPIKEKYWVSAIVRDITDRKHAEEERALNARRLAALLELNQMSAESINDLTHFALKEAVNLTGSSIGYIAFTNEDETVLTMYCWPTTATAEGAIKDKPILYPVDSTGLWGEAIRQRRPIITNDCTVDNPWENGTPEGHVRIVRHMNVPVFHGNHIVIVAGVGNKSENYDEGDVRQLTLLMEGMWRIMHQRRAEEERKSLHDQLAQASKMEAVGRLAGGVAHDFNNLLTTILGYSEMILSQLVEEDPLRTEVDEIRKAGERAASLTQQLLAFSRKQVIKPRIIDLNAAVKDARKMLARLIGENIKLIFHLEPEIGHIKIDPHQIDQVLLNLAVNARDAMPNGGALTVATYHVAFDKEHLHANSEIAAGSYVVLSVTDTGVGMDKETKARLFEPFFSTKETGKGTGLGLAMVYGIAKQNGGTVTVYSEPGLGTVFRIYLPRTSEMPATALEPVRIASPTGNETVLLVEDDAMVRRLAQRILTHLGYEVLQAYDTDDAIRIFEEYPTPIHLLLTDVIMPGMNGVELYAHLRTIRAELKALFMSGYAEDVVVRHGVLPEGTEFIQKPFDMEDLANRVRQALDTH